MVSKKLPDNKSGFFCSLLYVVRGLKQKKLYISVILFPAEIAGGWVPLEFRFPLTVSFESDGFTSAIIELTLPFIKNVGTK